MCATPLGFLERSRVVLGPETPCYTYPVTVQDPKNKQPSLTDDLKRLWSAAVKVGATLAVVCHLLPPHYQAACHAVATLCGSH